jgi:hemerythrin superfamily protein
MKRLEILTKYLDTSNCPFCGAYSTCNYEGTPELDVDGARQIVSCNKCHSIWEEKFTFKGLVEIETKDGTKLEDITFPDYKAIITKLIEKKELLPSLLNIHPELTEIIEEKLKESS